MDNKVMDKSAATDTSGGTIPSGLHRVVRMTFRADAVEDFLTLFAEVEAHIRAQPGCRHVELLRDADWPDVFATFSVWDSQEALDAYRNSGFFRTTWSRTKVLFAAPPRAESYEGCNDETRRAR